MKRPLIAITMGDPASIGAEITMKALKNEELYQRCRPLVVGDSAVMEYVLHYLKTEGLSINSIQEVNQAKFTVGTIDVLNMDIIDTACLEFGQVSAEAGEAAFRYVEKAISLATAGEVDATVTNALNKEALNLAGHHFSGHTEIYAHFTNTSKYTMMLTHEDLRVVHVSTHVSLREACNRATKQRILDVITIAHKACRALGIEKPRVGVAGLNPHSGENGLFGTEELYEIIPAIETAVQNGILAEGPVSPDTVFPKARGGWYDIVVAMYHDQGHIPLKMAGFFYNRELETWESVAGVNITLGLPIIRTSVDHGTAYDMALSGKASEVSLVNAIDYAVTLSLNSRGADA